jgi:hypothetical protein
MPRYGSRAREGAGTGGSARVGRGQGVGDCWVGVSGALSAGSGPCEGPRGRGLWVAGFN